MKSVGARENDRRTCDGNTTAALFISVNNSLISEVSDGDDGSGGQDCGGVLGGVGNTAGVNVNEVNELNGEYSLNGLILLCGQSAPGQ